jgi:helix-turn-helix protein
MSREKAKQPEYGTELKLVAVRRVLAGESVAAVAQELGIRRKRLYVWKDRYAEKPCSPPVCPSFFPVFWGKPVPLRQIYLGSLKLIVTPV